MIKNGFFLKPDPSRKYLDQIEAYRKRRGEYEERDENMPHEEHYRHYEAIEKTWGRLQGLTRSNQLPSIEMLHGKPGRTPVLNQDHASIWCYKGKPVVLVSMPYLSSESKFSDAKIKEFGKKHGIDRYRMQYPGWHNPPHTALDVWM